MLGLGFEILAALSGFYIAVLAGGECDVVSLAHEIESLTETQNLENFA